MRARGATWRHVVAVAAVMATAGGACTGDASDGEGVVTTAATPTTTEAGAGLESDGAVRPVVGRPAEGSVALMEGEPRDLGGGCRAFPRNHFWHAVVSELPVHPRSDAFLAALAETSGDVLRITASSAPWEGSFGGRPVNLIGPEDDVPERPVTYFEARPGAGTHRRDPPAMPLPDGFTYEGYPNPAGAWDKHVLVIDTRTCTGWELFFADIAVSRATGTLLAAAGAKWDLTTVDGPIDASGNPNPIGTNVARVPIVGGNTPYEEVAGGRIDHAVHMCVTGASQEAVWPARWSDGLGTGPDAPPIGTWLRLRPDVDLTPYGDEVRVLLNGLATHGAIITDSCAANARLSLEPDPRWDPAQWRGLELPWELFEVVDASGIAVDPDNTFEIR